MNGTNAIAEKHGASFLEICLFLLISFFTAGKDGLASICLFLFIALCPIGDLILQGTPLRSLGMSLSIYPLCALALMKGGQWLLSTKFNIHSKVMISSSYIIITAVYGLIIFGFYSHGENLLWKGLTSLVSLCAILFAVTLNYESPVVRPAIFAAFALLSLGFLFGNSNPFGLPAWTENTFLHFTPLVDERPRGLTSEPAQLSITVMIMGLLSAHMSRSRRWKIFLLLATIGLLIASGSKGGILTLFICAIILSVIRWHSKWYQVVTLLLVLFPVGLWLIWLIPNLFPEESFAISATVPTRFSMILCALITVSHHPFGVGLPGFLPAVGRYLPGAMATVESYVPIPLYFGEVSEYLTSADTVSTKTFFFDQLMRFGIPFACVFIIFIFSLLKWLTARGQIVLLIATLATTVAIMTYIPGTGNFAVPIVFGVALSGVRNGSTTRRSK